MKLSAPGWDDPEALQDFLTGFTGVLKRAARGRWLLTGDTLALVARGSIPARGRTWYVCSPDANDDAFDVDGIEVEVRHVPHQNNLYLLGHVWVPQNWLFRPYDDPIPRPNVSRNGAALVRVSTVLPYMLQIPHMVGSVLDLTMPGWFTKTAVGARDHGLGCFFTPERKATAQAMLKRFYEIAGQAGIADRIWVGFGGLLGIVRDGDWIPHDNDMDMCFHSTDDGAAEKRYYELMKQPGSFDGKRSMFEYRERGPEVTTDTGRPVWFSCGPMSPHKGHGVKCCHWFGWKHNGMWWHSKGARWITSHKFSRYGSEVKKAQAVALGLNYAYCSELMPYNHHGVQVLVPKNAGACCDFWYPGWVAPRSGGQSAQTNIMLIGKWSDRSTWRMVV